MIVNLVFKEGHRCHNHDIRGQGSVRRGACGREAQDQVVGVSGADGQPGTRGRFVRRPRTEVHTPSLRAAAACRSAAGFSYRVVRCRRGLPSGAIRAAIWLMVLYEPFWDPAILLIVSSIRVPPMS